jgi:excisionase family DNA binding protein
MKEFNGEQYYRVLEAAEILPLSAYTIRKYLHNRRLTGKKIGRDWHISQLNIEEFLKSCSNEKK